MEAVIAAIKELNCKYKTYTVSRWGLRRLIRKEARSFSTGLSATEGTVRVYDDAGNLIFAPKARSLCSSAPRIPFSVWMSAQYVIVANRFLCIGGSLNSADVYVVA